MNGYLHDKDPEQPVTNGFLNRKYTVTNGFGGEATFLVTGAKLNSTVNGIDASKSDEASKTPRLHISEHYEVREAPVGTIRPVRIICIGAGASVVNLAYQVQ